MMPVIFFLFWVILNGSLTVEIAVFGIAISIVVYFFCCRFLGYSIKKELRVYRKIGLIIGYPFLVLLEIFKANICVLRIIYRRKPKPEPVLIHFHVNLKTDAAKVALANSITLTPGTITVSLEENEYCVHCLDRSLAEGIEDSSFVRYLQKLEAK